MVFALQLCDPTCLLALSVVVLSLLWWLSTRRPSGLPPGPGPALPIVGHLYMLKKDPRPKFHEWRRQYGDVFSFYMGGRLVVVMSGYDVIKEAFVKFADVFSDHPPLYFFDMMAKGKGIAFNSGAEWKQQRKVSLEILRELGLGKNVLAERVQEEVSHYIKALHSYQGQEVDVARTTQVSVSNNICTVVFGKRFDYDDSTFIRNMELIDQMFKMTEDMSLANFFPWLRFIPGDILGLKKSLAAKKEIEDMLPRPQMDDHFRSYTEGEINDFIHAYIREIRKHEQKGQASKTINKENLLEVIIDLFFAGTETTSTALRWAVAFFLHNPEIQDKCFDEIQRVVGTARAPNIRDRPELTYVEATIMEVLRMGNIVPLGVPHGTARDVVFRGYHIPKDTVVIPFMESALQDPQVWDQPESFRPHRFIDPDGKLIKPDEFIPFSIGRRVCLGESLARMELFLYLTAMIQHFRFLPPEDGQLPSLEGNLSVTYVPKHYKVRVVPRE